MVTEFIVPAGKFTFKVSLEPEAIVIRSGRKVVYTLYIKTPLVDVLHAIDLALEGESTFAQLLDWETEQLLALGYTQGKKYLAKDNETVLSFTSEKPLPRGYPDVLFRFSSPYAFFWYGNREEEGVQTLPSPAEVVLYSLLQYQEKLAGGLLLDVSEEYGETTLSQEIARFRVSWGLT